MISISTLISNAIEFVVLLFYIFTLWPLGVIKFLLPRQRKDITGEIMFITGAGSGIGRMMSIKFAELGAILICTDLNGETAEETANMIKSNGGKAFSYKLDVTNRKEVYSLAEQVKKEVGDVTMLVNNAGIVTGRHLLDCPDELIAKTMDVNCTSHFWTIKAFLRPMIAKNHGHVITIASIAGFAGAPQVVDYCASKFGAVGLHDSLFIELSGNPDNQVKTSVVCPYFIKTGMFEGAYSSTPLTLPMMEVDYAVEQTVAGVLNNEVEIFVPRTLIPLVIFKSMVPSNLRLKMANYFRLHDQMKYFIGRKNKDE